MGYTTSFDGYISIEPPLNESEISFLTDLAETRRMHRSKGPLYISQDGDYGQAKSDDIHDYNEPDPSQPGLWLQWVPTHNGTALEWDGGEKFYESAEWMKYLVENLLSPSAQGYLVQHMNEDPRLVNFTADHVLNGEIEAQGEDTADHWWLVVEDNQVGIAETSTVRKETRLI